MQNKIGAFTHISLQNHLLHIYHCKIEISHIFMQFLPEERSIPQERVGILLKFFKKRIICKYNACMQETKFSKSLYDSSGPAGIRVNQKFGH